MQYNCCDIEITLAECEENPDTIDRLKDAFDKFYGGMEKFDSPAREALCQHPAGSNYVLKAADILENGFEEFYRNGTLIIHKD